MNAVNAAEVVERFIVYATRCAEGWAARWRCPWLEDCFISEAASALWKNATYHRPDEHGEYVPRFVRVVVRRVCWKRYREERRGNPTAFHQSTATNAEGVVIDPLDVIEGREIEPGAILGDAESIERILGVLPPDRAALVAAHVIDEQPYTTIAAATGLPAFVARDRVNAALGKLRTTMGATR